MTDLAIHGIVLLALVVQPVNGRIIRTPQTNNQVRVILSLK